VSAYEGQAYTSDVPYEGAVCWHLQPVLRVSLNTPIILHVWVTEEVYKGGEEG
jgi:hypothetical protein